jgi:regulator of RNase E activity RraA
VDVPAIEAIPAEHLEALRREDCTAIYNVMKFAGLAAPDAYSGPELRCLFPDLTLPIIGYAMTSEWTAGETGGVNVDSLAWLDYMEASPGPKIAVLADVGSQPGRGGIVGDGMMAEYRAFGCVGAVVGGSVMDIIPMTGLRFAGFGRPVSIGPLSVANGDILMADQGGVIRIPRASVARIVEGIPAFRALERSAAETINRPGLTAAELRAWYASNEPEFLGDAEE